MGRTHPKPVRPIVVVQRVHVRRVEVQVATVVLVVRNRQRCSPRHWNSCDTPTQGNITTYCIYRRTFRNPDIKLSITARNMASDTSIRHDRFYTDSGLLNLSGTLSQVLAIRNAGLILFCVGKGILFIYIFSCLYFFLTLCVLSPCIIMPSRQLLRQQLHLLGKRRILLHTDMPHILQQS